jgi:glycosyltransferase involved in cell wall biosynthesis
VPEALSDPLISVVIPVYDEEGTLHEIVARCLAQPFRVELVCVDDGSADGSVAILRELEAAHPEVRVLLHPKNRGKGAALRTGFEAARGEVILVQDADLEYDPADWALLLKPILDGRAHVCYGSRFLGGPHRVLNYHHYLANRSLTALSNIATNLNLTDMETCYKAFRREVMSGLELTEDRFGFEPEFTAQVAWAGYKIYEVPISYSGRDYDEGKKIGWRDGVRALQVIGLSRLRIDLRRFKRRFG